MEDRPQPPPGRKAPLAYGNVVSGSPSFDSFLGKRVTVLTVSGARYECRIVSYDFPSNLLVESARRVVEDPESPEGLAYIDEGVLVLKGDDVALIGDRG